MAAERRRASRVGALLRTLLLALAIAFLVGLLIGTWLRIQLERPVRYIGAAGSPGPPAGSTVAADPGDVFDAPTRVLVAGHHEEQVREPIQVA